LQALADYVRVLLADNGLPGAKGGSEAELTVAGLAREKDWDVAYEFAGKFRLLVSLKSVWRNAAGTVPNRLDDHMGELANIQQMRPEIVIGYVVLFDVQADSIRKEDGLTWSEFFRQRIERIAIRKAPLWNQGLLEASWFIRIDSGKPRGARVLDREATAVRGERFVRDLLSELKRREPAIPFSRPIAE
jgi:hypothetical protein